MIFVGYLEVIVRYLRGKLFSCEEVDEVERRGAGEGKTRGERSFISRGGELC